MAAWEKLGLIFSPGGSHSPEWLKEFAQAPCVLVRDDYIRVYFSCRPAPDNNGQYKSYGAFVDLDRGDLRKILRVSRLPILNLGQVGTFDEFGTYPWSVVEEGPIVHGYYGGWTRCESVPFNVAIGYAKSIDGGETFTRIGAGPILSYSQDEPFVISGPKVRRFNGQWQLFYIAGRKWISTPGQPEPVYKIRMATSLDGVTWEKQNRDLITNRLEDDEAQASPDVFFSCGRYHMFFCYRRSTDYRCREGGYRIGYAYSSDLLNWSRDDAKAGIDVSDSGWDAEMVSYPHVFSLDGSIYMLYLGTQVGRHGFGAARLVGNLD